ncbi:MAG: HNH endonuclease signature motif containing protein, partial [Acidimicrobiia bacterium]
STILDLGRATRTIPAPLWNALVIRDRHCRYPGCDRPAHWCDGHHLQPWEHGGATRPDNLVFLCVRHHHHLHEPGWHAKLLPDLALEVTAPDGTHHVSPAPRTLTRGGDPDGGPPDRGPP